MGNIADKQGRHAANHENVIVIGLNDWSALLIRYLQRQVPQRQRVIALLEEDPRWIGRSVYGVQVFGPPTHLEAAVEEFAAHGLRTDRVVVGSEPSELSREALAEMRCLWGARP